MNWSSFSGLVLSSCDFILDFEISKSEHCTVPSFNFIRRPVFSSIKDSSPTEKDVNNIVGALFVL